MWNYEKRLQFPIKITEPNAKLAQFIISQYGGPDGELGASMRYLSQRYTMPYREVSGLLTDIGTEELAHFETVSYTHLLPVKGLINSGKIVPHLKASSRSSQMLVICCQGT